MLLSVVWVAPAAFAMISEVGLRRLNGDAPATLQQLLWRGGDWAVYAVVTPFVLWFANRWPIARPRVVRRVVLHLGAALAFCVAWAVGGKLLELGLALIFAPDSVRKAVSSAGPHLLSSLGVNVGGWIFVTLPFGVVVYGCIDGMAHAMRYFVESTGREAQMARLSEQLTAARFSALQSQVNPHFLFNTLNTIAVRARDGDNAGTVRMVQQLSDVLRRTLSRHRANEVTIGKELDLVEQYLAIEQARFSDRLRVTVDADATLRSAAVPSFAVQHLVENAVRHGIARRPGAGRVVIATRREGDALAVDVSDDGPGIDGGAPPPAGHGIDNTRERLRVLHGDRASLTYARAPGGGTVASLRVPYRELVLDADVAGD